MSTSSSSILLQHLTTAALLEYVRSHLKPYQNFFPKDENNGRVHVRLDGLHHLEDKLKKAFNLEDPHLLHHKDFQYWIYLTALLDELYLRGIEGFYLN